MRSNTRNFLIICSIFLFAVSREIKPIIEDSLQDLVREHEGVVPQQEAALPPDDVTIGESLEREAIVDPSSLIQTIIYHLYRKMSDLQILWLIEGSVLANIVTVGTARELHSDLGVSRHAGREYHRFNVGYQPLDREARQLANRPPGGQSYAFFSDLQEHTLVTFLDGSGEHVNSIEDSFRLFKDVIQCTASIYLRESNKAALTPKQLTENSWQAILGGEPQSGCFCILNAIINPRNEIHISNLGGTWAGLYRNEELVAETVPQTHDDGSPFELCVLSGRHIPSISDEVEDSLQYTWGAEAGDLFVTVSKEVRSILQPDEIAKAFHLIEHLGGVTSSFPSQDTFDLFAMGIAKAARMSAGTEAFQDMMVLVLEIGPARR